MQAQTEIRDGVHTPERDSKTVEEAAAVWYSHWEVEGLEHSTLMQYRNHLRRYIVPAIGRVKLAKLTTPLIGEFRDELLRHHSRAMTRKVLASLKSIIGEARRRGLVGHNAAEPIGIPLKRRDRRRILAGRDFPTKQEVNRIISSVEDRWRPIIVTAIFTGMRSSELRGLTWDAVDFDAKRIHVRQRADAWNVMGAPKSEAGDRYLPMSPLVLNTLREWRLACPPGKPNLVFPNGSGRIENHSNILNRGFYALQTELGIVGADGKHKYGLHALRHFFASWAIEHGYTPKKLQALLGHSSIQMTFDTYGGLFPDDEDDQAKFAAAERELLATNVRPIG